MASPLAKGLFHRAIGESGAFFSGTLAPATLAESEQHGLESAAALAGDLFIGYSTWKWIEVHARTGAVPVFRYSFERKIPVAPDTMINGKRATAADVGGRHAGEIEYVFGTLDSVPKITWAPEDRALSALMMSYWTNFARSGDPGGPGLPAWPRYEGEKYPVMRLSETSKAVPDPLRARYELLDVHITRRAAAPASGR